MPAWPRLRCSSSACNISRNAPCVAPIFAETIANAVTEEAVRADYDKFVADFVPSEEIRASHILVRPRKRPRPSRPSSMAAPISPPSPRKSRSIRARPMAAISASSARA